MRYLLKLLLLVTLVFPWKAIGYDLVKVAVHIEPPIVDFINNEFVGRHIEIAQALVIAMGKDIQFIQCPFARCFSMLQKGDVDWFEKNQGTTKTISFLKSPMQYQHFPLRFYVNTKNAIKIHTYEDLEGLTLEVLRGGSYFERFDQDKKLIKIEMTTHEQLVNMMHKKRIDTFLKREESVLPWINKENYDVKFSLDKLKSSVEHQAIFADIE